MSKVVWKAKDKYDCSDLEDDVYELMSVLVYKWYEGEMIKDARKQDEAS